jgi:hypothetical protein
MLDSAPVAVVRRLYEARGNPEVIRQVLAPDVPAASLPRLAGEPRSIFPRNSQ